MEIPDQASRNKTMNVMKYSESTISDCLSKNILNQKIYFSNLSTFLCLSIFMYVSFSYLYIPNEAIDYNNYYLGYINASAGFDIGYEFLCYVARDIFGLSFEFFWLFLISLEILLLLFFYKKSLILILAMPSVIFLGEGFLGNQIRFALSIIIILVLNRHINRDNNYFLGGLVATTLHYVSLIILVIGLIYRKFSFKSLIVVSIFIAILTDIVMNNYLLIFEGTRMVNYYDSEFFAPRSSKSIFYIVFLLLIYFSIWLSGFRSIQFNFGFLLLLFSLATSSIAIVSGRVLLTYCIVEPIITYELISKRKYKFAIFIFITSISKLLMQ
jgi:EpsG family